jgi:uncharacterized protein YbjT (DUF2867 family)
MKTALIAGSTGLVGKNLLFYLLESSRYEKVIALVRREMVISDSKLIQIKTDFSNLEELGKELKADDVFCCLGTTLGKAGSKQKFLEVDFEFPVTLAKVSKKNRAGQFLIVSALGAEKTSSIFYNQVKGKMEDAISDIRFNAIHFFRPSLLLGTRSESRPGENAAKIAYRIFWFLIPRKYKAIEAEKVARAMHYYAGREQTGVFYHESEELHHF